MNVDIDEYQQSNINQEESEVELQEEQHYFINYQSLKQDIVFYILTLTQILFVFIIKWVINNEEFENSNSESSVQQNKQQNYKNSQDSNLNIIWSSLNVVILMAIISSLIYSITIYKKRMKKSYYLLNSILNYFMITLISGYIFSKPSPNQNIFFIEQSIPIDKVYEGREDNEQTEMYDLYFVLMISNKVQNHSELLISVIFKIMLHISIIIIQLNKTSVKGYIPIALCAIQFIIYDIIHIIWIRNQQRNQMLFCQCFEQNCPHSNENQQSQYSPQINRLQSSGINQFSYSHQIHTDGTIFNEISSMKHIPLSVNHSYCLKNFNNISRTGLIGKKSILIENCNSAQLASNKQKKTKKVNTFSTRNFWSSNRKSQIKQSVDFIQADEKWQQYLNQIPSGIILIKKNLDQVKFANEFIKQFFLKNFQKFNDEQILDMILRQIEFKILSHVVSHISNEKKRITRFSTSAKKQIRESISNAEKKQGKRISHNTNNELYSNSKNDIDQNTNDLNKNSMKNIPVFSHSRNNSHQDEQNSQKSPVISHQTNNSLHGQNINQIDQTKLEKTTLETILKNFDQNHSQRDIENSTLEIYAKVMNAENKESISIKGKVLYRSEGDEFLIIIEDNTNFENVTNLADRDDYKNRLISSFSHELRTPLNSSMGFLQSALLDDLINQEVKDTYLIPAYQSLKLQYYFINDILDFSQILAKKDLQLNFIKFHITKLVCDIKELYENSFASKDISLLFQVDSKVLNWEICTDYDRLMQVLVNLINNSLRFTLKGGVTIKITPTIQNNLSVYVIDTGEGMNMLQFEQIKLKLASFGMTGVPITETQHTGFGLTISQIIVSILASESNQDLEIKKTQGGGCTFSFCIENIMNIQASYSTSHNNSKIDVLKTGSRAIIRKDTSKQTHVHKSLEKQSSQSLYAKQNKELKRIGSSSISKIDDSKTPKAGTYRAQASVFKKSIQQQQSELSISNTNKIKVDEIPDKKILDLQLIIKKEIKEKYFRSNSMQKYHMNLSQYESPKQFYEIGQGYINEQIKTQPIFQISSPINSADDGMQISGFNFINQQNSSYSQQKRFFITQSQAMLTSYNNILLQKEKSIKNYDNEYEDVQQSLLQSDSIVSHNDCFENKLQQYNFNNLIHPNASIFTSPIRQVNSPVQKQSLIGQAIQSEQKSAQNNSALINISKFDSSNKQNQSQNYALSSINSDIFHQITESIETSMHLSQKFVDNVSTSAYMPVQEKSLIECIEIQTPCQNQIEIKTETEVASTSQLNGGEKMFKFNINSNQSIQTNTNNENYLLIKNNNLQDTKKTDQPTKAIIVTPGSKRQTPHRQNSVKFCFQTECKAVSDKQVYIGSLNSPSSQQSDQKYGNKGDFYQSPNNNEDSFGTKKEVILENDQVNEDNINKIVQKLIQFDTSKQKLNKKDAQNNNNNIQSQNLNNEISQSNAYQNNLIIKPIDNINHELQNQMQLSEQCSEFSWMNPQNFQNGIQYNQLIHSAILNKKSQSSSAGSQQVNQNIYFNIGRMRQIFENSNNSPQLKFLNTQNNNSNDTETANFNIQKDPSVQNLSKQQINSIQLRKDYIKSENKIDNTTSIKVENQFNQDDINKISIDERIAKIDKTQGNIVSLKNVCISNKIIYKNLAQDNQESIQDNEGIFKKNQRSEIIEQSIAAQFQKHTRCNCKRILCVDDEIFNLQVLLLLLKKLDYTIEKAFNGQEAINTFLSFYNQKNKHSCDSINCTIFKAIILDCNMPIMNGWDCAKELRNLMSQKKLPSIPIIALTAYVAQQAYNQCIESGMDEVLNKPVNLQALQNTIENYIELYELEQERVQHF